MASGGFDLGFDTNLDTSWLNQSGGMPNLTPYSGGGNDFQFTQFQPGSSQYANFTPNAADLPYYQQGGWEGSMTTPGGQPSYSGGSDVLRSMGSYGGQPTSPGGYQPNPQAQFSQDQSFAPSAGQPTGSAGSQQASKKDDDWKKMLLKMGIGGGIGLAGELGKGLMNQGGQSKPQSSPMPQPPSQATPATAPLVPLPGTKASPLISGMPNQAQGSLGLQTQDRMRHGGSTGGFQLY